MAEKKLTCDAGRAARLLVQSQPTVLNEEEINATFGPIVFTALTEVASAFEVGITTVKNTWRPNGMPGEAQRGPGGKGSYNLAEIVIWLLKRTKTNAANRGADNYTARKRDAETRAAEAEALIKERKAEVITGDYIPLSVAVSVVKGYANKLRDGLMGLSRELAPMFPSKFATQWTGEVERKHRNLLTAFSEASISDLESAANERNESDV